MKINWPREFPGVHWLDEKEDQVVLDVLHKRSPFRYYGLKKPKYVETLEAAACKFYGMQYTLGVNSGTGALMTAMTALQIGPGCEVIVPGFFWVSPVGAIVQANAIPVLCEVDDTFTMDPVDLERKITPRTKLILVVHMAGAVSDMKTIMAIAKKRGIPVLEDCAQANGGEFQGKKVGTFGTVGIYSLQMNKNMTAGEGGLIVTNDKKLYDRLVAAHDVGLPWVNGTPDPTEKQAVTWGCGRRMSEVIGAIGSVQIKKLPKVIKHMRDSKRRIKKMLAGTPGLEFRRLHDEKGDTGCFMIMILKDSRTAKDTVEHMKTAGLYSACRLEEYGLHIYFNIPQLVNKVPLSPAGNPWNLKENESSVYDYNKGACPQSDEWFARSILLPIPSCLTPEQETAAVEIIKKALG